MSMGVVGGRGRGGRQWMKEGREVYGWMHGGEDSAAMTSVTRCPTPTTTKQDERTKTTKHHDLRFPLAFFVFFSLRPLPALICTHRRKPSSFPPTPPDKPSLVTSSSSAARASPPPSWWAGCPAGTCGPGGSPARSPGPFCTRTTPCARSWSCLCRGMVGVGSGSVTGARRAGIAWARIGHMRSHPNMLGHAPLG